MQLIACTAEANVNVKTRKNRKKLVKLLLFYKIIYTLTACPATRPKFAINNCIFFFILQFSIAKLGL